MATDVIRPTNFPRCNLLLDRLTAELLREKIQDCLFRTITLPNADSISVLISIVRQIECVECVELKEVNKIIVWVNIETDISKDLRPFYIKPGILAYKKNESYPISILKANELMVNGIFNIYDKIFKIELVNFQLTHNNKLFVPYVLYLEC
jgi:hypothetical protein